MRGRCSRWPDRRRRAPHTDFVLATQPGVPARDEEFGEEEALTFVSTHISEPVSEIQAAVLRAVREHSVSAAPQDDLTVVVARFTPTGGGIGQAAA